MALFVTTFFLCALINAAVLGLDYGTKADKKSYLRAQNILLMAQGVLFLGLNLMTLKMYWRFSNPIEHRMVFQVSQSLEQSYRSITNKGQLGASAESN